MYVHDISLLSDHCAVSVKLKVSTDNLIDDNMLDDGTHKKCIPLPDAFIWSEEAKLLYQRVFESHDVKDKTSDIEKEADAPDVSIQSLIDKLTDVMVFAGKKLCLGGHLN